MQAVYNTWIMNLRFRSHRVADLVSSSVHARRILNLRLVSRAKQSQNPTNNRVHPSRAVLKLRILRA